MFQRVSLLLFLFLNKGSDQPLGQVLSKLSVSSALPTGADIHITFHNIGFLEKPHEPLISEQFLVI